MNNLEFDALVTGYTEALLWTEERAQEDLSILGMANIRKDCHDFYESCSSDCEEFAEEFGWPQLGYDFWLTRNGHGVGFWDRDLEELGDRLTAACDSFGEVWDVLSYFG